MIDQDHSRGVIAMLVARFEGQQLNRLLLLKQAVDAGECLAAHHSSFLTTACGEAMSSKRIVDRHPDYHVLYARSVRLFKEITARALENELRAQSEARPAGSVPMH